VLAFVLYERKLCPHCGLHTDDCSVDEAEGAYTVEEAWCRVAPILRHVSKDHQEAGYMAWPVRKTPLRDPLEHDST
jgi:hypothetical protein